MITNEVQYRMAKTQTDRLRRLATELRGRPPIDGDLLSKLERDAVEGQLDELSAELAEYEGLVSGSLAVGPITNLHNLPDFLVRARIASGLKQRDLAIRLGIKEQQLQRYEATRYQSASLARLLEVAKALGVTETFPSVAAETKSSEQIIAGLSSLGLDPRFVRRRLAPASLRGKGSTGAKNSTAEVLDLAARLGRVFGWDPSSLLAGSLSGIDLNSMATARFKLPRNASRPRVAAYTVYAHYLAIVLLQAATETSPVRVPDDATAFREMWLVGGKPTFSSLVDFIWNLGIPILPLADPGFFHAAFWRVSGRDVIVLKQGNKSSSRWAFDLLHEVGHAISEPLANDFASVDSDEIDSLELEQEANLFAGDVLLDGRAEDLSQLAVKRAEGKVEWLKKAVIDVARHEDADVAALANYLAFRLASQGIDWWGTAANLQTTDEDPWEICRDNLIQRIDFTGLNPIDRELLVQAVSN